ncbi:MAG: 3-hydroxyacyl-CoA dehydrogenase NAD-binding domain-containing protein [Actinomycetes bacterium]
MSASYELPAEVVTESKLRYVDLPRRGGRAALITFDNGHDHTKPNTFGAGGLASLELAINEVAAQPDLVALALTGKPYIFAVGADLTGIGSVQTRDQALAIAQRGHAVFSLLGDLEIPTFAFINGAVMGGGLEVALHCDYRTVSSGAAALSFPECFLGLIPGWGGAYLLPRLIGVANATKVIIENPLNMNKQLKPSDALELGLADVLFEPADFVAQSLLWAADVVSGQLRVSRRSLDDEATWAAVVSAARSAVAERLHGAAPAPMRALDLIEAARTSDRTTAYAAEDNAIADLVMSEELRAGLYSFDLVQRRAKKPIGRPDPKLARAISKVGIVGAGLMAAQLALLFVRRFEVPVVINDLDADRVGVGVAGIHAEIAKLLKKKRISQDKANRLRALVSGSVDKSAFADCDLVLEAVFEELSIKRRVFAEVAAIVSDTCILATNTSSLSVTAMSEGMPAPERFVGLHFFNPVAVMPLLEIARADHTDEVTLATAFEIGKKLKKSCVLVKDAPAFVVNRLLTRLMAQVTAAADAGTTPEVADHALDDLGLPMSPFDLLALVGPAVAHHVSGTLAEAFPDRFHTSPGLAHLVEAGKSSVWMWVDGQKVVDPQVAVAFGTGTTPWTATEVHDRAVEALAEEIQLMLDDGVVAAVQDIDLCLILGAGWPFHLGGISPYLDRSGVSERINGRRFLPIGVASVPR